MRRKGQTVAIEQLIVFMAGVSMFLVFLVVFQTYQTGYQHLGRKDVLLLTADRLVAGLGELSTVEEGSEEMSIPRQAAGEDYFIQLRADGLNVSAVTGTTHVFIPLPALQVQGLVMSGRAESVRGRVTINRRGNNIILGQ